MSTQSIQKYDKMFIKSCKSIILSNKEISPGTCTFEHYVNKIRSIPHNFLFLLQIVVFFLTFLINTNNLG